MVFANTHLGPVLRIVMAHFTRKYYGFKQSLVNAISFSKTLAIVYNLCTIYLGLNTVNDNRNQLIFNVKNITATTQIKRAEP